MIKHATNKYLLAFYSALLLTLTYPSFNFSHLAWLALIPFFYSLERDSKKERVLTGFVFGIAFFSTVCYWLIHVSIPGYIAVVLFLAIWPALFSVYKIKRNFIEILLVPAVWVVLEFIRAHIFTGFPWALLGHTQYKNLYFIQIADVTGAYGVSFIIVFVNYCMYLGLKCKKRRLVYVALGILAMITLLVYGKVKMNKNFSVDYPVKIAVIQGNIPQEYKWDAKNFDVINNIYEELTKEQARLDPDIIIWPETAATRFFRDTDSKVNNVSNTNLLLGAIYEREEFIYNSAIFISDKGEIKDTYFKIHTVPFGEYVPFEAYMPWLREVIDKPIGTLRPGKEFTLFRLEQETHETSDNTIIKRIRFNRFGVLICFEDLFPELARAFVLKGASFLVNITNDAWFGDTSAPFQHVQSSVFRAIENRVPVVRSANTGISCFINPKGVIYKTLSVDGKATFVEGALNGEIYPGNTKTFYTRYGDAFIVFCCLIIAVCAAHLRKQKKDKHRNLSQ